MSSLAVRLAKAILTKLNVQIKESRKNSVISDGFYNRYSSGNKHSSIINIESFGSNNSLAELPMAINSASKHGSELVHRRSSTL